jgi:hypothetical protein
MTEKVDISNPDTGYKDDSQRFPFFHTFLSLLSFDESSPFNLFQSTPSHSTIARYLGTLYVKTMVSDRIPKTPDSFTQQG